MLYSILTTKIAPAHESRQKKSFIITVKDTKNADFDPKAVFIIQSFRRFFHPTCN